MKVMILDQGSPVTGQLMKKACELDQCQFTVVKIGSGFDVSLDSIEELVRREAPELLLIGGTEVGEEIAPALGIRLETGVAAHCVDIIKKDEGLAFMVPAFGGRVIGEIFIPGAEAGKPAIATVKPGILPDMEEDWQKQANLEIIEASPSEIPGAGDGGFVLESREARTFAARDIAKSKMVLCGGYGIGSRENWEKLEKLADALGGAAGCTRPVVDAGWGPDEYSMIGTSGRSVKPEVYVAFGVSGAAHHLCGIRDAGTIISINSDESAEIFGASDYKGEFDAAEVLDALIKEIEI